ncbi:hypothetical protein ThrDRAFT_02070 [Frankia casuarinae]|jgi:hypothetical protein|nr:MULTISPECIES: hypothetical protein [Frankia]ETA04460.1 hypothetical protein CcI6DRAFT_00234 [Frankia sp. CcI6]EYT92288.1 hypothetical protein ThrDRAFT_02070 [Frankia casuarinae]KDA42450.1 hypothetical protein BMG523Draft_02702 [Frankia sp. BMG5.23]KEZ38041.1 hypothetical protein CEDDRAFT_00368 [Frankia sp. CeD]OAA29992.1 hypothetical protein AAY23_101253 [Frankia casuarinae]
MTLFVVGPEIVGPEAIAAGETVDAEVLAARPGVAPGWDGAT